MGDSTSLEAVWPRLGVGTIMSFGKDFVSLIIRRGHGKMGSRPGLTAHGTGLVQYGNHPNLRH